MCSDLEERLVARIRYHGDRLMSGLPDWPNTSISIGGERLSIQAERLNPGPNLPQIFRHTIRIPLAGLVRVQELAGIETVGRLVLVDAEILADRKEDGPVLGVLGLRAWYDQYGRSHKVVMRMPDGTPIVGRWSTAYQGSQRYSIAAIRRGRRLAKRLFGSLVWSSAFKDPDFDWEGCRLAHFKLEASGIVVPCIVDADGEPRDAMLRQADDRRWLVSTDWQHLRPLLKRYNGGEFRAVTEDGGDTGGDHLDDLVLEDFRL